MRVEQRKFLLPDSYIDAWLEDNDLTREEALETLKPAQIEERITAADPVAWAYLNLVSPMNIPGLCASGDPLKLLPIQAQLARLEGNVIAECAAEVGKTQDIGVRLLHRMDTAPAGDTCAVVANTEKALKAIWRYVRDEVKANPQIGGGVERTDKRDMSIEFKNKNRFETRLCGADGESLRGLHVTGIVFADEAVKYKHIQIWNELWRCAMPGAVFRIYTTPDGDYSCPYYALSLRATSVNGKNFDDFEAVEASGAPEEFAEVLFKKIWISKRHLGPPLFTEKRLAGWRQKYNGEHTAGFLNNVDGLWGTPLSSVFPMYVIEPLLANIPEYRVVVAAVDREKGSVALSAAKLGEKGEEILVNKNESFDLKSRAAEVSKEIASYFPKEVAGLVGAQLYCGYDLGSLQDPSELLWAQVVGDKWIDVFRLHLKSFTYPEQGRVIVALDHASGHVTKYGLDPGNAGGSLVMELQQLEEYRECPFCHVALHFKERILAFGFGNSADEIDLTTGEPILNPDDRDKAGKMQPYRLSNKEFSTRVLERKIYSGSLVIARDNGAGNPALSGPQLLTNHTSKGEKSQKGERRFREKDDHHVDARRQVALLIVSALRKSGPTFVTANMDLVATAGPRESMHLFDKAGSFEYGDLVTGARADIFGGDY